MAIAPSHWISAIVSSGTKIEALMIATITSDIISIPIRPGYNILEAKKRTIKPGAKINVDQSNAVGKAVLIISISGIAAL